MIMGMYKCVPPYTKPWKQGGRQGGRGAPSKTSTPVVRNVQKYKAKNGSENPRGPNDGFGQGSNDEEDNTRNNSKGPEDDVAGSSNDAHDGPRDTEEEAEEDGEREPNPVELSARALDGNP
jgi:hypothetical protein